MRSTSLASLAERYRTGRPRTRWIVDGVLPSAGVTLLYGPSGAGKTGAAINMAMCVSSGVAWAERTVTDGGVLYIAAENYVGVQDRFHAAASAAGRHDIPLAIADRPIRGMARPGGAAEVFDLIETDQLSPLRLIIIDTLATVYGEHSQDESGAASTLMNECEALAVKCDCAVLIVHHTAKRGGEMRGSQIFEDRADAVLRLSLGGLITVEKQRNGLAGARFAFDIANTTITDGEELVSVQRVENVRELVSSASVVDEANSPKLTKVTDKMVAVECLIEITSAGNGVTYKEWQSACFARWPEKGAKARNTAFSKIYKALKDEGKILFRGDKITAKITSNPGNSIGNSEPKVTVTVTTPPLKGRVDGDMGRDDQVIDLPTKKATK